jgi:DNA-binding NarL/FixJ family response regulator
MSTEELMPDSSPETPPDPASAGRPIRVVLADDHQVVLDGHEKWLGDDKRFLVVGKSRTVEGAVALCRQFQPDIAVVDLRYFEQDRPDICKLIKEVSPVTKVAMYSAFSSAEQVSAAFQAGANGYFDKHAEGAFLPDVVEELMQGKTVLDPHIVVSIERFLGQTATGSDLLKLIADWRAKAERQEAQRALARLKPREFEIVRDLVSLGLNEKYDAVAAQFGFKTGGGLKDTLHRIRRHLNVKTNEELKSLWRRAHGNTSSPSS